MKIVGLDLAGVEHRPTGYCLLTGRQAETSLLYKDAEILTKIGEVQPAVVAIDAPLSLPPGRKSIEERTGNHLRECDRELLKRGIKFFPVTLGPMRKLTQRGINPRQILDGKGFAANRSLPRRRSRRFGNTSKTKRPRQAEAGLGKLGIKDLKNQLSDHELDTVTCAYVGKLFLEDKAVTYGAPNQGIVMPNGEKASK